MLSIRKLLAFTVAHDLISGGLILDIYTSWNVLATVPWVSQLYSCIFNKKVLLRDCKRCFARAVACPGGGGGWVGVVVGGGGSGG